MEHKPKQIIEQARTKARLALLESCYAEIQRICDAFSHDTGLAIERVSFDLMKVVEIGNESPKNFVNCAEIDHEAP